MENVNYIYGKTAKGELITLDDNTVEYYTRDESSDVELMDNCICRYLNDKD